MTERIKRPVIRDLEWCPECNAVVLSTQTIRECSDHEGMKEVRRMPLEDRPE